MLIMAQVQYIKDLYENEEKSLREISRITVTALKLSRNTPRRKTGTRTISRILSQRVIRCWVSSFPL